MENERELICFQMISKAGTAKSLCFQAIKKAKADELEEATSLIQQAKELFVEAHEFHNRLVKEEASGNQVAMGLLMTHAEDIMITAELSRELAEELIEIHEELRKLRGAIAESQGTLQQYRAI